jgi:hypothetical protein
MTDFLSNLLMRSTVDQPMATILQPRLPSLFEPQHRPEQSRPGGLDEITEETIPPVHQSASTWIPANDLPDGPSTLTRAKQPHPKFDVRQPTVTANVLPAETRRVTDKQIQAVPYVSPLQGPQPAILPRGDQAPVIKNDRLHETPPLISENAAYSPGVKSPSLGDVSRNHLQRRLGLIEEETMVEKTLSSPTKALHRPSVLNPFVLQQPIAIPSHLGEGRNLGQIRASESQQVIEIHIGRIEVRAMPPTTSGKRSSQPGAKTSLDDYLRARSGDKR